MHVAKYTACGVANLIAHFERAHNESRSYDNQNIDKSKTHLNYNLAEGVTGYQKYKDNLEHTYHINRADINTMVSIVVTLPKDYDGDPRTFFKDCKEFFDSRYGADNCIGAWVHIDEKSPHMHYGFTPTIPNKDYGKEGKTSKDYQCRLNAKKVISKTELQRLHPDLQAFLRQKQPDRTINIINGEVARNKGNRTVNELKAQDIERKAQELQAKDKAITAREKEITAKGKELSVQSAQLDKDLQDLRKFSNRPDKVEPVKVGISRKEYVPYKDYEKTYDTMSNALTAAERAESRVKQLSRQVTSQSKSLLEREVEAERSARQKAEDRARQAEDRLNAKESDRETARAMALNDVLNHYGVTDWQEIERFKGLVKQQEIKHFKELKEQERAKAHAHQHDRSIDRER